MINVQTYRNRNFAEPQRPVVKTGLEGTGTPVLALEMRKEKHLYEAALGLHPTWDWENVLLLNGSNLNF